MNVQALEQITPAKTWHDVEAAIALAVSLGILIDKRDMMPRGRDAKGKRVEWRRKRATPADVLGHCLHQNGSQNFTRPISTAKYHTSKTQHITPGRPLASTCYPIMIPDIDGPAWLTADLSWITYAQGANDAGDENRHLIPVLVMGGYEDSGFKRPWTKAAPSDHQMTNLAAVVAWLQCVFDYDAEGYFGHFDFDKASCPGRALRQWTEAARDGRADLVTDQQWQEALLRWNPHALPTFGADGDWGRESKYWLTMFQRQHGIKQTAVQDPFTELILLQRYPSIAQKVLDTSNMEPPQIVRFTTPRLDLSAAKVEVTATDEQKDRGDCDVEITIPFDEKEPTIDIKPPVEQIDDPEDPPESDWSDSYGDD